MIRRKVRRKTAKVRRKNECIWAKDKNATAIGQTIGKQLNRYFTRLQQFPIRGKRRTIGSFNEYYQS